MTTATRSKENNCDFSLFKTPIRSSILSSAPINDLTCYSNNLKHLKLTNTTNMIDLQTSSCTTPIRSNKNKFSTPGSIQRRRALGLVNSNSKPVCHILSSDELSTLSNLKELNNKNDEPVILQAPSPSMKCSHPEDDLPYQSNYTHRYQDTFNDLMSTEERVENMITNQINGVNIFAFHGGIENTIRYQSPQCSRVAVSTLLDILN